MYIVLGGRADKGENHPLFLEPSEQLRFSDQSVTVCGPNHFVCGCILCLWNFGGALFPTPIVLNSSMVFVFFKIWSRQLSSQLLGIAGSLLFLLKSHEVQMEGSYGLLIELFSNPSWRLNCTRNLTCKKKKKKQNLARTEKGWVERVSLADCSLY